MKKIALVPLDDRPCNLKFPVKLALAAGVEVVTPPKEILGCFTLPGKTVEIGRWLFEAAGSADAIIVSLDMLCYGGLVASRRSSVSEDDALKKLEVFSRIRSVSKARIFIFNILMRLSVTAESEKTKKIWQDVFEYSKIAGRDILSQGEKAILDRLVKRIPESVLEDYSSARKRNHGINREAVKLVRSGLADFLIIGKEDCSSAGLHVKEEEVLKKDIISASLKDKVKIMNGADELGALLTAKAVTASAVKKPVFAVRYSDNKGDKTALYEDAPVSEVISDHLEALDIRTVEGLKEADSILFVHSFKDVQIDLLQEKTVMRGSSERHLLKNFCSEIVMSKEIGKKTAVADVCYCNGGDPEFVGYLKDVYDLSGLDSYAGWNTAGNSIGCSIAQAVLPTNKTFLFERFIDDTGYQAVVRQKVNEKVKEMGLSQYNLGSDKDKVGKVMEEEMNAWLKLNFPNLPLATYHLSFSLPWPRTFEIDCDIIVP